MPEEKQLRLRAVVRQIYGGRLLMPHDLYPSLVPEHTARRLIENHYAEEDNGEHTLHVKRTYRRRDLKAEE